MKIKATNDADQCPRFLLISKDCKGDVRLHSTACVNRAHRYFKDSDEEVELFIDLTVEQSVIAKAALRRDWKESISVMRSASGCHGEITEVDLLPPKYSGPANFKEIILWSFFERVQKIAPTSELALMANEIIHSNIPNYDFNRIDHHRAKSKDLICRHMMRYYNEHRLALINLLRSPPDGLCFGFGSKEFDDFLDILYPIKKPKINDDWIEP